MHWANRWQGLRCRQQGIGTLQLAGEGEGLDPLTLQRAQYIHMWRSPHRVPPPQKRRSSRCTVGYVSVYGRPIYFAIHNPNPPMSTAPTTRPPASVTAASPHSCVKDSSAPMQTTTSCQKERGSGPERRVWKPPEQ